MNPHTLLVTIKDPTGRTRWMGTNFATFAAADRFIARNTEGRHDDLVTLHRDDGPAWVAWSGDAAADVLSLDPLYMGGVR